MTLTATDLWFPDIFQRFCAIGGYAHPSTQPEEARNSPRFKHHVRTGVRHEDARDGALGAELRGVFPASSGPVDQPALLLMATPMKVLVIEGTFGSGGRDHDSGFR